MAILNYTTKIPSGTTVHEIQGILGRKGAKSVSVDYDNEGAPSAVVFKLSINGQDIWFRLPQNSKGVLEALKSAKRRGECDKLAWGQISNEQAARVSWRILKDWVEAQLALIEAGQAQMAEVFLPYAIDAKGQTFFQRFLENTSRMLEAQTGS